jgi:hypothetical protein
MTVAIVSRYCRDSAWNVSRWHNENASRQQWNPIGSFVAMRDAHNLSHEGVGGVVGASYEGASPTSVLLRTCVGGRLVDVLVDVLVGGDSRDDALTSGCEARRIDSLDSLDQPSRPTTSDESRSRTPSSPSFVSVVRHGAGDDLRTSLRRREARLYVRRPQKDNCRFSLLNDYRGSNDPVGRTTLPIVSSDLRGPDRAVGVKG